MPCLVPSTMYWASTRRGTRNFLACTSPRVKERTSGLEVLSDLQNRGVRDILICCVDGLKGFPDAIQSVFPDTSVQLCVVHQIRNSLKYVGSKHQKEFLRDLKTVYGAVSKETAESQLDMLDGKWGEMYPIVIKSWRDNWERLSEYFQYTPAIRKMIYTTNTVEGYHRQVRKVTKNKGVFPSDTSLEKLVYLAYRNIREKWTMPLANWALISQQYLLMKEEVIHHCLVMNSVSNVARSIRYLHDANVFSIRAFLDNDEAGHRTREDFAKAGFKVEDMSVHYRSFKDLNEYHVHRVRKQQKGQSLKMPQTQTNSIKVKQVKHKMK